MTVSGEFRQVPCGAKRRIFAARRVRDCSKAWRGLSRGGWYGGVVLWDLVCREEFLPEGALLPVGGETHVREEAGLEGEEMVSESMGPIGVGFDDANHVDQQDEGIIY